LDRTGAGSGGHLCGRLATIMRVKLQWDDGYRHGLDHKQVAGPMQWQQLALARWNDGIGLNVGGGILAADQHVDQVCAHPKVDHVEPDDSNAEPRFGSQVLADVMSPVDSDQRSLAGHRVAVELGRQVVDRGSIDQGCPTTGAAIELCQWHRCDVRAAGAQRPSDLGHCQVGVENVFEHVLRNDHIESHVGEGLPLQILVAPAGRRCSFATRQHASPLGVGNELTLDVARALGAELLAKRRPGRCCSFVDREMPPVRECLVQDKKTTPAGVGYFRTRCT